MIDVLTYTFSHTEVRAAWRRFLLGFGIVPVILLGTALFRTESLQAGVFPLIFQMHLLLLQMITVLMTHRIWTVALREPMEDGRIAGLLLLPLSRTQTALGILITGLMIGIGTWLAAVLVYSAVLAVYGLYSGAALVPLGLVVRLVIGQLAALLTLLCLQYALAAETAYKPSWQLFGVLIPFIFLVLAMISQVFQPLAWLRFFTPVTLTAGRSVLGARPGTVRIAIQLLAALNLILRARKQFARRDIRPVLAETSQ